MPSPSTVAHVTKSAIGQLCDGPVCATCNTCASCGRVLDGTPHVERCACPTGQFHHVCDRCLANAPLTTIDRFGDSLLSSAARDVRLS